jgi:hypothetical protein
LLDHVEAFASPFSLGPPVIREAAECAAKKLRLYYLKTSPIHLVSVAMDPRLKLQYFRDESWNSDIEESVIPA